MAAPPLARSTPPTRKVGLIALLKPAAEAVICLFVPASLHSTLVKVTVPLPAPAPMFNVVVPSNEPEPAVRPSDTFKLAGNPMVEVLPNGSCDLTTGWIASGEAVRERPPGGVLMTNWTAVAGLTTMLPEAAFVKPVAVKLIVMVSATL